MQPITFQRSSDAVFGGVAALPPKGRARDLLEAREVNAPRLERLEVIGREVIADHRDQADGREEARAGAEVVR